MTEPEARTKECRMESPRQYRMTPQQQRISDLLTLGKDTKEIAREIGISPRTVEDHRGAIFKKCGVRNAVELTLKMKCGVAS